MFYKLRIPAWTILLLSFAAFSTQAYAQACGKYFITVSVQDMAGKPIPNAEVKLSAITVDETKGKQFIRDAKDPLLYTIDFYEGTSFKEFHKLTVSALGYKTTERQVKFLSCANRKVIVKLSKDDVSASAAWQFENKVNVEAVADGDTDIDGAKLTVIDSQNKEQDVPIQKWYAIFDLPNGEYTFRFEAPGYETRNEKVDLTPLADKSLKVILIKKKLATN